MALLLWRSLPFRRAEKRKRLPPLLRHAHWRMALRLSALREQRRRVERKPLQLLAVERDAEAGLVGDGKAPLAGEREGRGEDAVDIGAAADVLDEIDMGKRRGELQIGGEA